MSASMVSEPEYFEVESPQTKMVGLVEASAGGVAGAAALARAAVARRRAAAAVRASFMGVLR
jgi:hypothetical protein